MNLQPRWMPLLTQNVRATRREVALQGLFVAAHTIAAPFFLVLAGLSLIAAEYHRKRWNYTRALLRYQQQETKRTVWRAEEVARGR